MTLRNKVYQDATALRILVEVDIEFFFLFSKGKLKNSLLSLNVHINMKI